MARPWFGLNSRVLFTIKQLYRLAGNPSLIRPHLKASYIIISGAQYSLALSVLRPRIGLSDGTLCLVIRRPLGLLGNRYQVLLMGNPDF